MASGSMPHMSSQCAKCSAVRRQCMEAQLRVIVPPYSALQLCMLCPGSTALITRCRSQYNLRTVILHTKGHHPQLCKHKFSIVVLDQNTYYKWGFPKLDDVTIVSAIFMACCSLICLPVLAGFDLNNFPQNLTTYATGRCPPCWARVHYQSMP